MNHVVELVAPVLLFCPRDARVLGGIIQVGFQVALILSGNLSFLNWLTIVPAVMCFDDDALLAAMERLPLVFDAAKCRRRLAELYADNESSRPSPSSSQGGRSRALKKYAGKGVHLGLFCLLVGLSRRVVQNLFHNGQVMNASFDSFKLLNTYGAFGSITRERFEVIIEATWDADWQQGPGPGPGREEGKEGGTDAAAPVTWHEYEFKCKPGRPSARPCVLGPYHHRIDWLMWFASFGSIEGNPWLVHLLYKLLQNKEGAKSLLKKCPGPSEQAKPQAIRARLYKYAFAKAGSGSEASDGAVEKEWWERTLVRDYFPGALTLQQPALQRYLAAHGWGAEEADAAGKTREEVAEPTREEL